MNKNNRVYLTGYLGRDYLSFGNFGIDFGNRTATARLNHIFNSRLFSNTSFIYSRYDYTIRSTSGANDIEFKSKIEDLSVKQDLQYFVNGRNKLNFGVQVTHHTLSPGVVEASESSSYNSLNLPDKLGLESAVYVSMIFHRLKN